MTTFSTNTQENFLATSPIRPRIRSRTASLISVSSGVSLGSIFGTSKTNSISQCPDRREAYGSFIPLPSATSTLRDFVSYYPSSIDIRPLQKKRRRVTFAFDDRPSASFSYGGNSDSDESPSSESPYITRSSLHCPPSPISSSSSIQTSHHVASDLHPILANLERQSRLCTQVIQCSACGKAGSDFPRCAKCGAMWCSRPCRLVGGKRHIC